MAPLTFHSTNGQAPRVDLKQALLAGQAPDRGLYLPDRIPELSADRIADLRGKPYADVAFDVLSAYTDGVIEPEALRALCRDAYDYAVPLEPVAGVERVHVLRLDQGPTASFKDFAARMMARLIGRFLQEDRRELLILTATSGDTGSAVASAFHNVPGVRVLVLFPREEVSERQRRQMTTLGDNIRTIALEGKFDDCQALVKRAFSDPDLADLDLSSANSINIGRLLPQTVYYFYAAAQVAEPDEPVVVAVPSGNFGNMMGCMLAGRMGLKLRKLVVPVNANDEFPVFLRTGRYARIEPSRACISNAMNVGHPSNLARLVELYGGWLDETGCLHRAPDFAAMRRDLFSVAVSDDATRAAIRQAWRDHRLLLEPHGAVGWQGLLEYRRAEGLDGAPAVVVETAHPAKFPDEIERLLGFTPEVPGALARLEGLPEDYDALPPRYELLKDYLLERYGGARASAH